MCVTSYLAGKMYSDMLNLLNSFIIPLIFVVVVHGFYSHVYACMNVCVRVCTCVCMCVMCVCLCIYICVCMDSGARLPVIFILRLVLYCHSVESVNCLV